MKGKPLPNLAEAAPEKASVADILEKIVQEVEAGQSVDLEGYKVRWPEHADAIGRLLPTLRVLRELGNSAETSVRAEMGPTGFDSMPKTLGDFRILREIGRGGMGIVYEAEQVSLGRRVALKVLPFAAALDPRQLQRFKNEAHAAASLRHGHIVRVYSVGCEQSVHFYAMEYIEGQSLAQIIAGLRKTASASSTTWTLPRTTPWVAGGGEATRPGAVVTPAPSPTAVERQTPPPEPVSLAPDTDRHPNAASDTQKSNGTEAFFRTVAELGIQAAEALQHAHQMGVVHRDVKPSNLLIDTAGNLLVADFGLAQTQTVTNITVTGDVLGTLRYMSPEQASNRRQELDHRTDIYSLGTTLYELVTLRPPFLGEERKSILRQITDEEPPLLRQFNKTVPKDLETIILKAMSKEPHARYATAQKMADDLRHFLKHEPVVARRVTWVGQAWRWCRRNRLTAGLGAVAAVALAGLCLVGLSTVLAAMLGAGRIPSVPPAPRVVRLTTEPPGATLVVHPIDPQSGEPRPEYAVRPDGVSPVQIELVPGDYLVIAVASTAGFSFHEVYRRVPGPDAGLAGIFGHNGWEFATDGAVVLPTIAIPRDSVNRGMAHFAEMERVTIGSPDRMDVPAHQRRVPGFWLDTTEVRVREYLANPGPFEQSSHFYRENGLHPADDDALTFVSYDDATAYAERIGKRLPTEWEYELATTKGGTQSFPWGDDVGKITEWTYGKAGTPAWDRLDTDPPVFGLYSNVAEWTSSWPTLYPKHRKDALPPEEGPSTKRIVRGGSPSIIKGRPQRDEWLRGPQDRSPMIRQTWSPGLGFRCARSDKPHLRAEDFARENPE